MTKRKWTSLAVIAATILAAYFINVEVQTYLGKKALRASGLAIHTLGEAKTLAQRESKLILADLSAIWCPTCRTLDRRVLSKETVRKTIEAHYIFARIEYESAEGEAFRKHYQLSGFPNLLILKPSGELVRKLPLTFDPEQFQKSLMF